MFHQRGVGQEYQESISLHYLPSITRKGSGGITRRCNTVMDWKTEALVGLNRATKVTVVGL